LLPRHRQNAKNLGNILGLDQWEEYRKRAAERIKDQQGNVNQIDGRLAEIQQDLDDEPNLKAQHDLLQASLAKASAEVRSAQAQLEQKRLIEEQLAGQRKIVATLQQQVDRLLAEQNGQQTRLERTQQELTAVNQELAREDEIKAAYDRLVSLRQELAAMDALDEQARPLETRRQELERQIELARQALQQELRMLEQEKAALTAEQQQNEARTAEQKELAGQIAALDAQIATKESLESEQQSLKNELAAKQAEIATFEKQGKDVRERLAQVSAVEGAACPLCGQPLSTHDRARLQAELEQEQQGLAEQISAHRVSIAAISKQINELEKQLSQIKAAEIQRVNLVRLSDQLAQQIEAAQERATHWQQEKAPRLEEIRDVLAREAIAPEAQTELAQVKAAITQLGYDRAAHLQLREAVHAAEPAQDAYNHLAIARSSLVQLQRALAEQQADLAKKHADLSQTQAEYVQARAELEKATQSLPKIEMTPEQVANLKEEELITSRKLGAVRQQIDHLQKRRQEKESLRLEKDSLLKEIAHLKKLERAFSKEWRAGYVD